MLSNSACLAACYMAVSYGVKKRCFTVVNVSHNNYNRTGFKERFVFLFLFKRFFKYIFLFFKFKNYVVFLAYGNSGVKIHSLVYSSHYASFHKAFNYLRSRLSYFFRKLLNCKTFGDFHKSYFILFLYYRFGSRYGFCHVFIIFIVFLILLVVILLLVIIFSVIFTVFIFIEISAVSGLHILVRTIISLILRFFLISLVFLFIVFLIFLLFMLFCFFRIVILLFSLSLHIFRSFFFGISILDAVYHIAYLSDKFFINR